MTHTTITQTVPAALRARAAERPDDVAHEVVGIGQLTFASWERRSNAVAQAMIERGVTKGDRILLPCDTSDWLEYAVAYVAAHKAGAAAVPVSARLGQQHLDWALRASSAVASVGVFSVNGVSTWTSTVPELETGRTGDPINDRVEPDDPAEILYTSGTTGVPKGVVATHASVLFTHSANAVPGATRVVLHSLSPATTAGQGLLVQPLNGRPHAVITLPRHNDGTFVAIVDERRPTDIVVVPTLALSLIRMEDVHEFDLSSVQVVRTTSAPIPPAAFAKLDRLFPNAVTINMYASTESWPARTRMRFDPSRPGSVGRPTGGSAVRIADHDGNEVPHGVTGDVQLSLQGAPQRHYDGDPEASAKVFIPGGWVRTGDLGYIDDDGYLYLVDRNADLVISGGVNISTIEVEAALQEFSGVIESAAFGVPHEVLGEYVAAALRVTDDFLLSELNAYLAERLGPVKSPKRIVVVVDFPRSALGKVLKRELREKLTSELNDRESVLAPQTPTEKRVAEFWQEALEEEIGANANFLSLGGTSLTAMEITGQVRELLGREVKVRDLFEATDLADYARRVDNAPQAVTDSRRRIERVPRVAG